MILGYVRGERSLPMHFTHEGTLFHTKRHAYNPEEAKFFNESGADSKDINNITVSHF